MKQSKDGSCLDRPHVSGVSGLLAGSVPWPGPAACLLVYNQDGTGKFATLPDRLPVEDAALLAKMTRSDGIILISKGVLPVAGAADGNVQKECPALALVDVLGSPHWLDLATRVLAETRRGADRPAKHHEPPPQAILPAGAPKKGRIGPKKKANGAK